MHHFCYINCIFVTKKRYKKRIEYYPETVRQKHRTVQRRFSVLSPLSHYKFQPTQIRLATQSIMIEDERVWDKLFDDLEDVVLLHRWNWLLYDASKVGKRAQDDRLGL